MITPQGFYFMYYDYANYSNINVKAWDHELVKSYDIATPYKYEWQNNKYNNVNLRVFQTTSGSREFGLFNFGSLVNYKQYTKSSTNPSWVINDWNYID